MAAAPVAALSAAPASAGWMTKHWLWILLGLAAFFVFITNEVLLVANYKLYRQYRVQLIADRYLLVPHACFGSLALLIGPLQFSTRLRQRHLAFHRILGRLYVLSVVCAALLAMTINAGRPLFAGTIVQASAWIICTLAAFLTARNRHIAQHRQWMVRSYAVTFTFITLRILNIWPAYYNLPDATYMVVIIATTFGSVLLADLGLNWRELAHRRS